MENDCKVIGTVAEFGNWEIFRQIAKKGGDAGFDDIVDTCDIHAHFGEMALEPETIVSLFRDAKDQRRSNLWLMSKTLPFLSSYPKLDEISKFKAPASGNEPKVMSDFLDGYYSKVSLAHDLFGFPDYPEEAGVLQTIYGICAENGRADLMLAAFYWACRSEKYPSSAFEAFYSGYMLAYQIMRSSPDTPKEIIDSKDKCAELAPAARKEIIARVEKELAQVAQFLPQQGAAVGDIIPVESVLQEVVKHKATLVYIWSPSCEYCEEAMPAIAKIEKSLKLAGGGVVGVSLYSHKKEDIAKMKQKFGAGWYDVVVNDEEASKINPSNGVPTFLVVGGDGRITSIMQGYSEEVRSAILDELRTLLPNLREATEI